MPEPRPSGENVPPKNEVNVETVLNYRNQCGGKYGDINYSTKTFIQKELGLKHNEDPVLVDRSETKPGDKLTLSVDQEQLSALGILYGVDLFSVTSNKAGAYRALIQNADGEHRESIEVRVKLTMRPPGDNPFIISPDLASELEISEGNGKIRILNVYPQDFSWPGKNVRLLRDRETS